MDHDSDNRDAEFPSVSLDIKFNLFRSASCNALKLSNCELLNPAVNPLRGSGAWRSGGSLTDISEVSVELRRQKEEMSKAIERDYPLFDFTASLTQNTEQDIFTVIKHFFPEEDTSKLKIKKLTGGITNQLYFVKHLSCKPSAVLVRVSGENTDIIIDRDQELVMLVSLSAVKLAPPLYGRFTNGIIYGYVEGVSLLPEDLKDEHKALLIAQQLAYFHEKAEIPGVPSKPILFDTIKSWLCEAKAELLEDSEIEQKLRENNFSFEQFNLEITQLETELRRSALKIGYCHNDLLAGNILYHDSSPPAIHFIDFEYSGYNYCSFDIGNHFCEMMGFDVKQENYPSKEFQQRWLTTYLSHSYTNKNIPIPKDIDDLVRLFRIEVNRFALVAHLFWGVWALIQHRFSMNEEFDYLGYSMLRLQAYQRDKNWIVNN